MRGSRPCSLVLVLVIVDCRRECANEKLAEGAKECKRVTRIEVQRGILGFSSHLGCFLKGKSKLYVEM